MSVGALQSAADELLTAASEALTISPGGAASRVFISPSTPVWDCPDQLTVHVGAAVEADTVSLAPPLQPMQRVQLGVLLNLVQMTVTILRCIPGMTESGSAPSADDLEATANITNGDLWAIWNHLATRKRDGSLFAPKIREFIFDPAIPAQALGGIVGWQIQVRVQVDGFKTT